MRNFPYKCMFLQWRYIKLCVLGGFEEAGKNLYLKILHDLYVRSLHTIAQLIHLKSDTHKENPISEANNL